MHRDSLGTVQPIRAGEGAKATIIAGGFFGLASSVPTFSPMFYAELRLQRFAPVSGDLEFIPLPESLMPVDYP